jgi:hypothetical protein
MNKLYILGALALANVEALLSLGATASATGTVSYALIYIAPTTGVAGAYTYTVSTDCFSAGTATNLGLNNIYHQYYSFALAKGTATFGTVSLTTTLIAPATIILISITAAYSGCYHSHIYNWMAQP